MNAKVKRIVVKSNEAIEKKTVNYFSNFVSQVTLQAKDQKKAKFSRINI